MIMIVTVLILAVFVGLEVISRIPQTLHTPLMSATNAIHGVVVIGGILILGKATTLPETIIGMFAVLFGTLNVVGGFVVTDRMLEMFKSKRKAVGK